MPCRHLTITGMLLVAVALATVVSFANETLEQRRSRLEKMPSVEKDELRRNQQRLAKLDQQQQLRNLEQQLSQDPQGDRLRKVMLQYHEWLRALPSADRADLLTLPEEQRIPRIKELLEQQETERLRELAKESLSPEDVNQVRIWLADMVMQRKSELLQQLPEEKRRDLERSTDARRIMLEWSKHTRESHKPPVLMPAGLKIVEEDRQRLVEKLSTKARDFYQKAGNNERKQAILQNWIFATFRPHRPSPEELQEFLQHLPADVRDHLENLPPEQMKAELIRHYFENRRWYQDGKGPPFPGNRPNDRPGEMRKGPPRGPGPGSPPRQENE